MNFSKSQKKKFYKNGKKCAERGDLWYNGKNTEERMIPVATRENFELILAHKPPRAFVHMEDQCLIMAPGERNVGGEKQPDGSVIGKDWFGCTWTAMPGKGALDGATPTPGTEPLEDIADFASCIPTAEQVRAFDWKSFFDRQTVGLDRANQVVQVRSMSGFFERMHFLVGFENALCAFYEDPDAVHDYFAAMLEYKKTVAECVKEYADADVIIFDDDYGTAQSTFISPEMWREFLMPYWKELNAYVHSLGMKVELHSCGYITPLVGDFVECGFDILQPLQTHNDLKFIKENYGDKLVLRLAIFDKQMAAVGKSEDEVRADLRGWYEILAPGGGFIADVVPINDRYYEIQAEVQDAYEKELFGL